MRTGSRGAAFCSWRGARGATLVGFASWAGLMRRYPTGIISPFALLTPVWGLAIGALLLGASPAAMPVVAVLLVFAGLVVNVLGGHFRPR